MAKLELRNQVKAPTMALRRILWVWSIIALLAICASCSRAAPSRPKIEAPPGGVVLRGAGATFPSPLYEEWFRAYQKEHPRLAVAYDAVGSGAGIKRFIGKSTDLAEEDLIDFGASDAAMTDAEIAEVNRGVQLVPMTAGAVVLAYNLPELQDELRLTREAYSGIFLGEITKWNDPKIVATNPGLKKAAVTIALVARRDASGTTYALTNHLSAISEEWRGRFGAVQLVDWPGAAMRVDGNAGVAGRIKQSLGSIGYLELGFARQLGLRRAWLQNKAGRFVRATAESGRRRSAPHSYPRISGSFIPTPTARTRTRSSR